jgi:hypothetical protein
LGSASNSVATNARWQLLQVENPSRYSSWHRWAEYR